MCQVQLLWCKWKFHVNFQKLTKYSTTSYVTPCPVTKTITVGGYETTYTTETDSTVYTTYTATVYPTQSLAPYTQDVVTTVM